MVGYWWRCDLDATHVSSSFEAVGGLPLVRFFYDLAERGWDQTLLRKPCSVCQRGEMRITYDFPRANEPVCLRLLHVVGLTGSVGFRDGVPSYLPMLWEAQPQDEEEPWIDFKYVGKGRRGYQNYGLNRPAVFARREILKLLHTYRLVVGHDLLGACGP
jgi:hypothetical protein